MKTLNVFAFAVLCSCLIFACDINLVDNEFQDGDAPGESIPYNNGVGTFIASNGDELYFTVSGAVMPSDHPDYDFEFQDQFTFTGGTGRFVGAKGNGMTYSFVDLAIDKTDHIWTAKMKLPK